MAYSKKQVADAKQAVRTGVKLASGTLSASNAQEVIELGDVCAKVTFQADGNLTGTIEFSVDGKSWSATVPLATAMTSYNTHNVCVVRVSRTGGEGKVSIAGK